MSDARNLRHDLRTPVNHIVGYADLLLEDGAASEPLCSALTALKEVAARLLPAITAVVSDDGGSTAPNLASLSELAEELATAAGPLRALAATAEAEDIERIVIAVVRFQALVSEIRPAEPAAAVVTAVAGRPSRLGAPLILVVDDDPANRDVLSRRLARLGYETAEAADGVEALDRMAAGDIDLVLLDLMMPVMDGYGVLTRRRDDPALRDIPVLMISASDEPENVVRCIELGAEDYLPKPFDPTLLKARVGACIEKKRLHDQEKSLLETVTRQAKELRTLTEDLEGRVLEKSAEVERLGRMRRFLPPQLAEVIASGGDHLLESHRREITVLFSDLRGFTSFSETSEPEDVMDVLREMHGGVVPLVFAEEGTLTQFTGDGMIVIFNDPLPCDDPAARAVRLALAMRERTIELAEGWARRGFRVELGIGVAKGFATCGSIGFEGRYEYTAIGTVMNLASRLCSAAKGGEIIISQRVRADVDGLVDCAPAGEFELKGLATPVPAFLVTGQR